MALRLCRFDAHVALVSVLTGETAEVPVCRSPALHMEVMAFTPIAGVTVQFDTAVCDEHLLKLSASRFHKRSIKLRQST